MPQTDNLVLTGIAAFDVVLAGNLNSDFIGRGAAGDEVSPIHASRCHVDDMVSQLFLRFIGELGAVGKAECFGLFSNSVRNFFDTMADRNDKHATNGVHITLAIIIVQVNTFAAHSHFRRSTPVVVKNMGVIRIHTASLLVLLKTKSKTVVKIIQVALVASVDQCPGCVVVIAAVIRLAWGFVHVR